MSILYVFPGLISGQPQIPADKACYTVLSYVGVRGPMYQILDPQDVSESSDCIPRLLKGGDNMSVNSFPESF